MHKILKKNPAVTYRTGTYTRKTYQCFFDYGTLFKKKEEATILTFIYL